MSVEKGLHNSSQLYKMLNKNYHVDKKFNFRDKNKDKGRVVGDCYITTHLYYRNKIYWLI